MTRRADSGLTLIELLVSIAILGVIMPVLAQVFFTGNRVVSDATDQLARSHSRQMAAALFTPDVQDAKTVDTDGGVSTCLVAGDTLVARFRWTETDSAGASTQRVVAYVLATTGTGEQQLVRRECDGGVSAPAVTVVSEAASASLTCLDGNLATVTCPSFAAARLTVTDSAGTFSVTGVRRS